MAELPVGTHDGLGKSHRKTGDEKRRLLTG